MRSSLLAAAAAGDTGTLSVGENTDEEVALDKLSVASTLSFTGDAGGVGSFFALPDLKAEKI